MRWLVLSGTSPTPLTSEPANRLDNSIMIYSGSSNRNQDNQWLALRVHDVPERSLAKLRGQGQAMGLQPLGKLVSACLRTKMQLSRSDSVAIFQCDQRKARCNGEREMGEKLGVARNV